MDYSGKGVLGGINNVGFSSHIESYCDFNLFAVEFKYAYFYEKKH